MSRIAVYRTDVLGYAVQPAVSVNGRQTGRCQPNGVFFVDVKPGTHQIIAQNQATASIRVTTKANETTYVQCSLKVGVVAGRPSLTQIATQSGAAVSNGLVLTGEYTVQ